MPPGTTCVVTSCSSSASQVTRSRRIDSSSAGPDGRVEPLEGRRGSAVDGHGDVGLLDAVEPRGEYSVIASTPR